MKFKRNVKSVVALLCFAAFLVSSCSSSKSSEKNSAYLFTYFVGNGPGEESIHYALSADGYHYGALNHNEPVINTDSISSTGGVRDPHLLRGEDGMFYMVATDLYVPEMGWKNYAMVLMKSEDLINWTSSVVNIPESFPEKYGDVMRVWAPQTIYDAKADKYMIYFSMKQGEDPDKIYYAYANKDFTALESAPEQLFVSTTNNACIDGDIVKHDGKFYLFMKSEDGEPGIKLAISDELTKGYSLTSKERVDEETHPVEGSGIFKLNDKEEWILMYDLYTQGGYQFTKSSDLRKFKVIDEDICMNFHPRHGSVLPITQEEAERLASKWGSLSHGIITATSSAVKENNIIIDEKASNVYVPVNPDVDLTAFDPGFSTIPGMHISPQTPQDFSKEPVSYTVKIGDQPEIKIEVTASEDHNPVVEGYYADPEIIYSEKNKKFYLYPTSDGFNNWSGTYFETFSSDDLVHWKNEGTILDLHQDVSWADRNAWAPTAIEKKIGDAYKYFYYFTAAQKVGVAVADDPAGPFKDSGKALIDFRPEGIKGGQEIDPDVFMDPVSGKSYLYWGNGYLACVELNEDMMSIDKSTLKVLTPDETFREGTEVFYRKGKYYVLWSENDTRSEDYRVRYGTTDSPTGKLTIAEDNLVIAKDPEHQIYGTGHNSVIQVPGKDEWYIVYHRFTRPKGISMGYSAGYHREVCIDKLVFDDAGNIIETIPTVKGIQPVVVE